MEMVQRTLMLPIEIIQPLVPGLEARKAAPLPIAGAAATGRLDISVSETKLSPSQEVLRIFGEPEADPRPGSLHPISAC